ncbi:MAG: hypothetical protein U1D30_24800 [Planctomycetota bacterium]
MNSNSWRSREQLADASDLVDELRSFEFPESDAKDASSTRERMDEFRQRLLEIAEHVEAHERTLFAQRDALREQLLAVRVEIQREKKLLEAARRFRRQHAIPEGSRIGYVAPRSENQELEAESNRGERLKISPDVSRECDVADPTPKDALPRACRLRGDSTATSWSEPNAIEATETLSQSPSLPSFPGGQTDCNEDTADDPAPSGLGTMLEKVDSAAVTPKLAEEVRRPTASLLTRARTSSLKMTSLTTENGGTQAGMLDGEWEIPVRWWNLGPLVALSLLLVFGVGWGSIDLLRAHLSKLEVAMEVEDPATSAEKLEKLLASRHESPLARHDGERDYVVACAMRRLQGLTGSSSNGSTSPTEPAVYQNLRRAVTRSPASVWNRLTLARIADRLQIHQEERDRVWQPIVDVACAEPLFREALADHYLQLGEKEWALTIYGTVLQGLPERTGPVLARLAESGIKRGEFLEIVPDSPMPMLETTRFLKSAGHSDWWTYPQKAMDRLIEQVGGQSQAELAATLSLCELVNKPDQATRVLEAGLARFPRRQDWQLKLAQLRYDRKEYEESGRLAKDILRERPASDEAKQARLLIEKIELASSRPGRGAKGTRPLSN